MIASEESAPRCRNEGCLRDAEPGEPYCGECGLERSLFRRDARIREAEGRTASRETPARR
ncbi:MAG TPA: hypothetical protein VGL03_06720 [Thermoanaerobaculia bacterium]|jgi:hypothetical protein